MNNPMEPLAARINAAVATVTPAKPRARYRRPTEQVNRETQKRRDEQCLASLASQASGACERFFHERGMPMPSIGKVTVIRGAMRDNHLRTVSRLQQARADAAAAVMGKPMPTKPATPQPEREIRPPTSGATPRQTLVWFTILADAQRRGVIRFATPTPTNDTPAP